MVDGGSDQIVRRNDFQHNHNHRIVRAHEHWICGRPSAVLHVFIRFDYCHVRLWHVVMAAQTVVWGT